jgi:CheY-like chemotaxis protein
MIKVLVAEDNPVNRELLREVLESHGYTVIEACDGEEALRRIEATPPDILLLDLGMPVMDGYTTVQHIRRNPAMATLPVLAVTAYAMQSDREKVMAAGFDGYLSKPIQMGVLFDEMQRLLAKTSEGIGKAKATNK